MRIVLFECDHDWAYAEGDSKGILSYEPRRLCFHRLCTKCHLHQEVNRYGDVIDGPDGRRYMADPHFIETQL